MGSIVATLLATTGSEPTLAGIAVQLALLLVLLGLSGAYSGSETVLFSLTPAQLERAAGSANPLRRLAAGLMRQPRRVLTTVLLMNTAVNVLLFATSYVLFHGLAARFGAWVTPVSGVLSVLLVVVCGEVTPKVLAVALAERLAPAAAAIVHFSSFAGAPLGRLIDGLLAEPFVRLVFGPRARAAEGMRPLSTADLKRLLEVSRRDGATSALETMYLREVIDLTQVSVHDVMVARVDMIAYDVNDSPEGLRELIRRTRFKKVPVYDGSIDNIVGLVYAKVLFFEPHRPLREIVSPVRFVPDVIHAEQLLQHFRRTKSQIAIVVDEYGGVTGLVTLEDVIEQIVGEIRRPGEAPEAAEVVQISEREYEVSARLSVRLWAELFDVDEITAHVSTLGGLLAQRLGRTVQCGDVVRVGNLELQVASMSGRRPERVRLRLLEPAAAVEKSAQ